MLQIFYWPTPERNGLLTNKQQCRFFPMDLYWILNFEKWQGQKKKKKKTYARMNNTKLDKKSDALKKLKFLRLVWLTSV